MPDQNDTDCIENMNKWIGIIAFLIIFLNSGTILAQRFLMDLVDTTNQMGKGMLSIYQRYDRVRMSGYIQPQFQVISQKGAETYNGGNFSPTVNNRFMLRRGRLRVDYAHLNDNAEPTSYFVFQFDGTERGVAIRDFWGRFYENKFKLFSLTTGMFARPFGNEVNLSSANRETPERGRMSQILMKTERDIGVMLTVSDRNKGSKWANVKFDLGVFNGQGMAGPMDYDSHKDFIGRISLKPTRFVKSSKAQLSAGISGYLGGITSQSNVLFRTQSINGGVFEMVKDSVGRNNGKVAPRKYAGVDAQVAFPNGKWETEFRGEYVWGNQTATWANSETPGTYPVTNGLRDPLYIRHFNGAYFYFLQHLGSLEHQFVAKYDWYDPNSTVAGKQITAEQGFSKADIRYNTFSFGYNYYANPSLKFMFFYDIVRNEKTNLEGFTNDVSDDVFTCRVQYSF